MYPHHLENIRVCEEGRQLYFSTFFDARYLIQHFDVHILTDIPRGIPGYWTQCLVNHPAVQLTITPEGDLFQFKYR